MELDGIHFDAADRMVLETCRDNGGEIQIITCREGVDDTAACALHRHAETMVQRGYLDRLLIAGTRSRVPGSARFVTLRARPVALALLDLLERAEVLEAELKALKVCQVTAKPRRGSRRSSAAAVTESAHTPGAADSAREGPIP